MNQIAMVEWTDSYSAFGWQGTDSLDGIRITKIISIGIIKFREEDVVVIPTQSITNGDIHSPIAIPKGSITKISYLKVEDVPANT
ncbi:MAG: hypothetical protein WC639_04800 [Patescibacteria group bacterium]|jgi:hypothetical protein